MPREERTPVLRASVADIRYFAALIRGVQFANRATVIIYETGLSIIVEEARTLLGTAFIVSDVFDDYEYNPRPPVPSPSLRTPKSPVSGHRKRVKPTERQEQERIQGALSSETESESEDENARRKDRDYQQEEGEDAPEAEPNPEYPAFEIPLNTLAECLNIFGTAGPVPSNSASRSSGSGGGRGRGKGENGGRRYQRLNEANPENNNNEGGEEGAEGENGRGIDAYFDGKSGKASTTSMRLSYMGDGFPLTLIIAADSSGPTTTCEVTTYDPEPHLELELDTSNIVLKIILNPSWLREALSELDPSCDKLTFIGNPKTVNVDMEEGYEHLNERQRQKRAQRAQAGKPMFRIRATGEFGSTEMDYPNDRDVLESFECDTTVSFTYRFSHIARTLKALSSSLKASLRIDEDGLLSMQFLMPSPKSKNGEPRQNGYIEFRCIALDDDL
ncbi:Rad1-domain-containing protein [Agrocybe pediades]|nr:Rad1-domain-containing protein [Agrocybe pediades]